MLAGADGDDGAFGFGFSLAASGKNDATLGGRLQRPCRLIEDAVAEGGDGSLRTSTWTLVVVLAMGVRDSF